MKLGHYIQTPAEKKRYTVSYSEWLDTGETIYTYTITSSNSAMQIAGSSRSDGNTTLVFFISGGVAGKQYTLDVQINTTGGQTKEDTILFDIRSA